MSTRANIVIKDSYGDQLIFYRHSDGYPEVTKKSLQIFMGWLNEGKIRDNVGQAAGWLIVLGAAEYGTGKEPGAGGYSGWKVGAYEPTTCIHGDIEYLYTIDLGKKKLTHKKV